MSGSTTLDWSVSERTIILMDNTSIILIAGVLTAKYGEIKMFILTIIFKEQNTKKPLITLW
jgi:hypothetical protein